MANKKNIMWFDNQMRDLQDKMYSFFELRKNIRPRFETFKIIIIYMVIGGLWILLSDQTLSVFIKDGDFFKEVQLYKGWIYVGITGCIFYFIISSKMNLFKLAADQVFEGYEELSSAYQELIAMEEELIQERELSEGIIHDAATLIIISDQNGRILKTNPFAEKVTGYTKEEVIGRNIVEFFVSKSQRESMDQLFGRIMNGELIRNYEIDILCKDGHLETVLWNTQSLHDQGGNIQGIVSIGMDITERRNMEKRLHFLAYYDQLTGLYSRTMIEEELGKQIQRKKNLNSKIGFIYLDIDNFRHINNTMGHRIGDQLIIHIAKILSKYIKAPNIIGRIGGDEFAFIINDVESDHDIVSKIDLILMDIRKPWILENREFFISVSSGAAIYPDHGTDLEALMQNANTAMSYVKENGKDRFCIYNSDMKQKTWKYIQMSNQLRAAISNEEFFLYYQPQIDLESNRVIGAEALIRWIQPERGFISPMEFIPFSEEIGYIDQIQDWVLETACTQKRSWEEQGYSDIKVSINLSGKTLTQEGLVERIGRVFQKCNMNCVGITFEITETAAMIDLEKAIKVLHQLKSLGAEIALDDFGTGYSSLTYLQKLPIDILKVDREFIKNIVEEDEESYIFSSIIDLAHNLGLKVTAEGVETKEQLAFLRKIKCDIGQGYYFSKPIPSGDFDKLLEANKSKN